MTNIHEHPSYTDPFACLPNHWQFLDRQLASQPGIRSTYKVHDLNISAGYLEYSRYYGKNPAQALPNEQKAYFFDESGCPIANRTFTEIGTPHIELYEGTEYRTYNFYEGGRMIMQYSTKEGANRVDSMLGQTVMTADYFNGRLNAFVLGSNFGVDEIVSPRMILSANEVQLKKRNRDYYNDPYHGLNLRGLEIVTNEVDEQGVGCELVDQEQKSIFTVQYSIAPDGKTVTLSQYHVPSGAMKYMVVPFEFDSNPALDIAQTSVYVEPETGIMSSPTWKDVSAYVPIEMKVVRPQ